MDRRALITTITARITTRLDKVKADRAGHAARVTALDTATAAQVRADLIRTRRELQRLRLLVLDDIRLDRAMTHRADDGQDDPGTDDTEGAP